MEREVGISAITSHTLQNKHLREKCKADVMNDHYLSQGSFERNKKKCDKWNEASKATRGS